jgi:hypothetical protein
LPGRVAHQARLFLPKEREMPTVVMTHFRPRPDINPDPVAEAQKSLVITALVEDMARALVLAGADLDDPAVCHSELRAVRFGGGAIEAYYDRILARARELRALGDDAALFPFGGRPHA